MNKLSLLSKIAKCNICREYILKCKTSKENEKIKNSPHIETFIPKKNYFTENKMDAKTNK